MKSVNQPVNFDPAGHWKMPLQTRFLQHGMAWFDLIKSESSNAFEAEAKDKRLHSSRKEFWIGLAKKHTVLSTNINRANSIFKKIKSQSCPKLQEPKIKRNIVYLHVSTGFCS